MVLSRAAEHVQSLLLAVALVGVMKAESTLPGCVHHIKLALRDEAIYLHLHAVTKVPSGIRLVPLVAPTYITTTTTISGSNKRNNTINNCH